MEIREPLVQREYDANKRALIRQKNIEMITRLLKDFGQISENSPDWAVERVNRLRATLHMWEELPEG